MNQQEEDIADRLTSLLNEMSILPSDQFHERLTDIRLDALRATLEESHEADIIHYACRSVEECFKDGPGDRRREIAFEDILKIRGLDSWREAFRRP